MLKVILNHLRQLSIFGPDLLLRGSLSKTQLPQSVLLPKRVKAVHLKDKLDSKRKEGLCTS